MSTQALEGASKYLNNLLLARGYLQDGKSIEFAHPTDQAGNTDATMAQVINLIHDLVLRRDRDAEQRESLTTNIRSLRVEEGQRMLDFQKLQDKNVQLKNDLSTAEAAQRTLSASVKKAESQVRELKEQMLKMKSTLDQVRAKCISDVRKRDGEIEKLKNHLTGMQRGRKDVGGMKINTINLQPNKVDREPRSGQPTNASEWTLDNESNDFLAALVDETTTENVALRKIVVDATFYLKSLTSEEDVENVDQADHDGIGIPGQYRQSRQQREAQSDSLIPVQNLAAEMSQVLAQCQTILKDPSFVPIEELQMREEEIAKLRAGWEKMAERWKEAVTMMSQWRQKIMNNHDSANFREDFEADCLSGLGGFGRSIAMRPDGQPVLGAIEEEELSSMLFDHGREDLDRSQPSLQYKSSDSFISEPEETGTPVPNCSRSSSRDETSEDESDLDLSEEHTQSKKLAASPARRGIRLPRPVSKPLSEINGNSKKRNMTLQSDSYGSVDELRLDEEENYAHLYQVQKPSKLPRLTVAEKLAAVEAEANEATQDLRRRQATQKRKTSDRDKKPRKSSRRRSTLSPEELAQLMAV